MQVELDEESAAFAEVVRRILREHPRPVGGPPASTPLPFDDALWGALAGGGFLEAVTPGVGDPMLLVLLAEEVGRALAPIPLMASTVLAGGLLHAVTPDAEVSAAVISGQARAALCVDARRFPAVSPFTATPDGSGRTVSGSTENVLGASEADHLLVLTRTDGVDELVLLTSRDSVTTRRSMFDLTGDAATLNLDHAPGRVVASGPHLPDQVDHAVLYARLAGAAELVGVAQHVLEMTLQHLRDRTQFGRPIGTFQALQHMCAQIALENEAALTAVRRAARAARNNDDNLPTHIHAATLTATRAADAAARGATQMHGGMGFTWEHDTHLYLRRSRSALSRFGTPATTTTTIATTLLTTNPHPTNQTTHQ